MLYPTPRTRALQFSGKPMFPAQQQGASDGLSMRYVADPATQERGLKFTNRGDSTLQGARQIQKEPGYVKTEKEKRAMKKPSAGSDDIQIDDPYSFDPYQWTNESVKADLDEIYVKTFGEDIEPDQLTAEQKIGLQQNIEHVRQKRLKRALDARTIALKKAEAEAKKASKGSLTEYQKHQIAKDRATKEVVPEGAWAPVKETDWDEYDRLRGGAKKPPAEKGGPRATKETGPKPDGKKIKILKVAKNPKTGEKLGLTEEGKWVPIQ